jgi:hypothetical protein
VFNIRVAQSAEWARVPWNGEFLAVPGTDGTFFLAAAGVCDGEVSNENITTVTTMPPVSTFGDGWGEGTYSADSHYSTTSNLPKVRQLQAVANDTGSNPMHGKGAAFAAGWPKDDSGSGNNYEYWSGELLYANDGPESYWKAIYVTLVDGDLNSLIVDNADPVAVCVGP